MADYYRKTKKDMTLGEILFARYASTLGFKLDKGLISDEKYERLYIKLLEWKLE